MTTREFLKRHGISLWRLPRLVRRFHSAAAEEAENLKVYPGLLDALTSLSAGGTGSASFHRTRRRPSANVCTSTAQEGLFAFVVGYPRFFGKGKALRRIVRAECLPLRKCSMSAMSSATSMRRTRLASPPSP